MSLVQLLNVLKDVPGALPMGAPPLSPGLTAPLDSSLPITQVDGDSFGTLRGRDRVVVFEGQEPDAAAPSSAKSEAAAGSTDSSAYYVSFRYGLERWGIYIKASGMASFGRSIAAATELPAETCAWEAFEFLERHERFHLNCDLAAAQVELISQRPAYLELHNRSRGEHPGYVELEEALANAFAVFGRTREVKEALSDRLQYSPAGYRDFFKYSTKAARLKGRNDLIGMYAAGLSMPLPQNFGAALIDDRSPQLSGDRVPVYIVHDDRSSGLQFIDAIPVVSVSSKFSRSLRTLANSGRDYRKKWENAKTKMAVGNFDNGMHFERLRTKDRLYSIRLDASVRVVLSFDGSSWVALDVGTHDIYSAFS